MDNVDQLVQDYVSAADKQEELESDINLFAREVSEKLFLELDKEGVLVSFYDKYLSIKFTTHYTSAAKSLMFDVRLLDLGEYRNNLKLSVPELSRIKRATFEHEGAYDLKDELRTALTLLMFDLFGLAIKPQDMGQDEDIRLKL